ncbi:MAG: hypothetical protein GY847_11095 [Proteobacteria bacterium]|nr:hypothetical protein [Pseudomonadota bacterium]
MMSKKGIPDEIKAQVNEIIAQFNQGSGDPTCFYAVRFRGEYLYLDRSDFGQIGPICRLKYTGDMDDWEFAIFKWSSERYDPDEWMFPGLEHFDGTVKGAMMAGIYAYPA